MRNLLFAGLLALLFAAASWTQQSGIKSSGSSAMLTNSPQTVSLALTSLQAEANPFKADYGLWDSWLHEQISTGELTVYKHTRELDLEYREARATDPTVRFWSFLLDKDNNLIPMLRSMTMAREAQEAHRDEEFQAIPRFAVICHPPSDISAAREQAIVQHTANHKPKFPAWLVRNPPQAAFIVPTGDWVVRYDLASATQQGPAYGYESTEGDAEHVCGGVKYILYSPDGRVKSTVEDMQWWFLFYGTDKPAPEGRLDSRDSWYVRFRADNGDSDLDNDLILSTWTWDGHQVREEDVIPLQERPFQYFKTTAGHNIARYGALQN